jgi:hypothetical protein
MPWRSTTLAQFLPGVMALANSIAAAIQKKLAAIMLLKAILQAFLSGIIDQINAIQSLIAALEAAGFYVILLSPSKGNWSSRLRLAPNAPPEGTSQFCTTGICVIATAPSFDASMRAFMAALGALKKGIAMPDFSKSVVKQKSMHSKPKVPGPLIQTDVWISSASLLSLFPGVGAAISDLADGVIGFIADLQHTIAQIAAFASSAADLATAATSFINDLNGAGAGAIMLKPAPSGFVGRLMSEEGAPSQDSALYTIGFCACFYSINIHQCDEKYRQLSAIFNADIENYPEHYLGQKYYGGPETWYPYLPDGSLPDIYGADITSVLPKIKSWAIPAEGYYSKEVYVTLNCNIANATIYYTVNGLDPKLDKFCKIFDPYNPIHITQNNTVVKYYAKSGINIERRTRHTLYRIVQQLDSTIPYSPTLGVVAGVGIDPETKIADLTIPPITKWGKAEIASDLSVSGWVDPDSDHGGKNQLNILGDAGNLDRNLPNTIKGVSTEYSPPARGMSIIPPDEPDMVDAATIILDVSPGTWALGKYVFDDRVDAGIALVKPAYLATYGANPWGSTSNFPDANAKWIWNVETPANGLFDTDIPIIFTCYYENTTGSSLSATLYYMADNTATFYLNDVQMDTDTGWYQVGNLFLSSFQVADGYRVVELSLQPGQNTFKWIAVNWGGMAGLIFSLNSAGNLLLNSTETYPIGVLPPDLFIENDVKKSEYSVPLDELSFSIAIDVYYSKTFRLDLMDLYGCKIESILTGSTYDISISEDLYALEGLVDFPGAITLSVRMETGITVNVMLVSNTELLLSTDSEYAPVSHDLHYRVAEGLSVGITLSARNTSLYLEDSSLHYLVIDTPTKGALTGTGSVFQYTPYPGTAGSLDTFSYIARNMRENSELATITIEIVEN